MTTKRDERIETQASRTRVSPRASSSGVALGTFTAALLATVSCVPAQGGARAPARTQAGATSEHAEGEMAPRPSPRPGGYDLANSPVLSQAMMIVTRHYLDKWRVDWTRLLLGGIDFVQGDTPEVIVEHGYDPKEPWLTLRVNTTARTFPVGQLSHGWELIGQMRQILAFVQDHLVPVAPEEEGPRLLRLEVVVTKGVLAALDPHSTLLDPETYDEFRVRREVASVGVEVARGADDTVVIKRVVEGAAADRAGVVAGDRLLRIDDWATKNMNLDDVVAHLHGEEGSTLRLTVGDGGAQERTVTAIRGTLQGMSSVAAHRLIKERGGSHETPIGYVRVEHFGGDVERGLHDVLRSFAGEQVRGVILDLRGNPGGLYDQAIRVSDLFLKSERIVSMVGPDGVRRDDQARDNGDEVGVPIVLLVDGGSAAASEIVATALKESDRAVVVGAKTFGSATVQQLFDIISPLDSQARLGLKVTTAQWVGPGDTSVQGTGLTPDIALVAEPLSDVAGVPPFPWVPTREGTEAQLLGHLPGMGKAPDDARSTSLPFVYLTRSPGSAFEDSQGRDFALAFASALLAAVRSSSRVAMLDESKSFIAKARADEERRLVAVLEKRGIDWSAGGPRSVEGHLQLEVELAPGKPNAGEPVVLRAVAKNAGGKPLHRVRAISRAQFSLFEGRELVFGAIAPGKSKVAELAIKVPENVPSSSHLVSLEGLCDECSAVPRAEVVAQIGRPAPPIFAVHYRTVEAGAPRKELMVTIENIGGGVGKDVVLMLRRAPGQRDVLVDVGFFRTETIEPGKSASYTFVYEDLREAARQLRRFDLVVGEEGALGSATHRIALAPGGSSGHLVPPIITASTAPVVGGSSVRIAGEASSAAGMRDVFVSVRRLGAPPPVRKVFYLANTGSNHRMPFVADVPVLPGSNELLVTARGTDGCATTYPLSVLAINPR